VVDEIGADAVVPSGHERDLQLRPDAVGAGHENRLLGPPVIEAKQPPERADIGQDIGGERRPRQRPDTPDRVVAGVDVHSRLAVFHLPLEALGAVQKSNWPMSVCISARAAEVSGDAQ
jgi:hypothetical protein